MSQRPAPVAVALRTFPFSFALLTAALGLIVGLAVWAEVEATGAFDPGDLLRRFLDGGAVVPVIILFVIALGLGLRFDSARWARRRGEWDEVLSLPTSTVERLATQGLTEAGWRVERAADDFTVFTRPGMARAVATLTVEPVVGGSRVQLTMTALGADGSAVMHRLRDDASRRWSAVARGEKIDGVLGR